MRTLLLSGLVALTVVACGSAPSADEAETVEAAQTDSDPFSAGWLDGAPVTTADAVAWFAEGGQYAVLGHYDVRARRRMCNPTTGCGQWIVNSELSLAADSWDPRRGRIEASVDSHTGQIGLTLFAGKCAPGECDTGFVRGAACQGIGSGALGCAPYVYRAESWSSSWTPEQVWQFLDAQARTFNGKLTKDGVWGKAAGSLYRDIYGVLHGGRSPNADAAWIEYEVVAFGRFTTLPGEHDWDDAPGTSFRGVPDPDAAVLSVRAPATWDEASARCRSIGGRLAAWSSGIGTPSRWTDARRAADGTSFWSANAGSLDWLNPTAWSSRWRPGEPNDAGGVEDCVEIVPTGQINDISCDEVRSYSCDVSVGFP
jgi:C-type mannose receptor